MKKNLSHVCQISITSQTPHHRRQTAKHMATPVASLTSTCPNSHLLSSFNRDVFLLIADFFDLADISSLDLTCTALHAHTRSLPTNMLWQKLPLKFRCSSVPESYSDVMRRAAGICSVCLLLHISRDDDICDHCRRKSNTTTTLSRSVAESRRTELLSHWKHSIAICEQEYANVQISHKALWSMLVRGAISNNGFSNSDLRSFAKKRSLEQMVAQRKRSLINKYLIPDYIPTYEYCRLPAVVLVLGAFIRHRIQDDTVEFIHVDWAGVRAALMSLEWENMRVLLENNTRKKNSQPS